MDGPGVGVGLNQVVGDAVGEFAVGEEEDGVGLEGESHGEGGAGVGRSLGLEASRPGKGAVDGVAGGGGRNPAGHGPGLVVEEDDEVTLGELEASQGAVEFLLEAEPAAGVGHAAGGVDDEDEEGAWSAESVERGLAPRGQIGPVDGRGRGLSVGGRSEQFGGRPIGWAQRGDDDVLGREDVRQREKKDRPRFAVHCRGWVRAEAGFGPDGLGEGEAVENDDGF